MSDVLVGRKRNVLRLNLNESREDFFHKGRRRSFNNRERPKTEKASEPTVEIKSGTRYREARPKVSQAVRRVREGV